MPPKAIERNAYAGVVMGTESGTPVAAQRIWQEHVQKELRFQVVREEYTRNPATVLLLPEKPTDLRRELALRRDKDAESDRAAVLEALKEKDPRAHADVVGRLERADKSPRKKYSFPQTSGQEYGWDLNLAKRHLDESKNFVQPHTNGDITEFADKYVSSHGFNPFSTRQFKYLARSNAPKK